MDDLQSPPSYGCSPCGFVFNLLRHAAAGTVKSLNYRAVKRERRYKLRQNRRHYNQEKMVLKPLLTFN